jgi:sugar fermentation stimulation protein A
MKYGEIAKGEWVKKINRFSAEVMINDNLETVHIKNTVQLKELLVTDADVLLEVSNTIKRKTKYSIIAVSKNGNWVNIDSLAPNAFMKLKNE